jgi:uncharacterized membrane protein (GlpM family)
MTSLAWLALALKMALSAGVVVLASLAVERAGPVIGALIVSLPLSAGPAYVFLALEHGPDFVAAAALASLPAMVATAAFQIAYVALAPRHATLPSLAGAIAAWLAAAFATSAAGWGFAALASASLAAYLAAWGYARRRIAWRLGARPPRRWWDLPSRAGAVMLVTLATLLAGRLAGPEAAGLLALAPVVYISMVLVLHPRIGGQNSAAVVGSSPLGMIGITLALCVVHLAATPLGSAAALAGGLAVSAAWNLALLAASRRAAARRP